MAARADPNGAPSAVTAHSSPIRAPVGMPGTAISAASGARARSQTIMTLRRGQRSARPDSSSPPRNCGAMLAA